MSRSLPWQNTTIVILLLQFLTLPALSLPVVALEDPDFEASAQALSGLRFPGSWRSRGSALTSSPTTATLEPLPAPPPPPPNRSTSTSSGNNRSGGPILVQANSTVVPGGTRLEAIYPAAERIVVTPDETMDLTLEVAESLRSFNGTVLIPAGSEIEGRLEPRNGGTQFVAETLILQNTGQQVPFDAISQVVTRTETIRRGTNTAAILQGAAIGAAAATVVDLIFGDNKIGLGTVLIGATLGAGTGWALDGRETATVLVVDSVEDLDLTLQSDLVFR